MILLPWREEMAAISTIHRLGGGPGHNTQRRKPKCQQKLMNS